MRHVTDGITASRWDFFIAHAGPDLPTAENLYDLLSGSAKVFLDSRSLELGDDWDRELPKAQKDSLITVVLVSSKTGAAYYEREEIRSAIALSRDHPLRYRVIPLSLDDGIGQTTGPPYGLGVKHGLFLSKEGSLEKIALRLLEALNRSKYQTVLFDARDGGVANNFRGRAGAFYKGKGADARATSPVGEGTLQIDATGVLTITRTTRDGRFEVYPRRSGLGRSGNNRVFAASSVITVERTIWFHCEARSASGKQGLRIVLKHEPKDTWLASEKRVIESSDWVALDIYFHVDPKLEFFIRIDNEEVSQIPSELQLRGIVVREKDVI